MANFTSFPPNPLSSDSLNIRANVTEGEIKATPLTAAEVRRYLQEFHEAEALYRATMSDLYDRTRKASIFNIGVQFQNQRDSILAEYLEWDSAKKQFDDGLITFEEFINNITTAMMAVYNSGDSQG